MLLFADLAGWIAPNGSVLLGLHPLALSEQPDSAVPATLIGLLVLPLPAMAAVMLVAIRSEYQLRRRPVRPSRSGAAASRRRQRSMSRLAATLGLGVVFMLFGGVMTIAGAGTPAVAVEAESSSPQGVLTLLGTLVVLGSALATATAVVYWWRSGPRWKKSRTG